MNIPDEFEETPQINIVPMIDVIFAILTFFIMASLFLSRSEGLPVNLPKASTAQSQQQSKIAITINESGQISLNRRTVALNELASQIQTLMGTQTTALVVINADTKVEHGQVIAVMDALRTVEGAQVGIATQRSAAPAQ
ncbi:MULTISPECIES: biopolymer transporter ExbD [unclassified Leptolyngbya]|uniref:ExbD/TolR family protein n=1 Tax=unclassified Leptolyngbya TaxID=2650499 RepID=UPI00168708AE|nr:MULTISPECIES: biopolymer transporter ExbD [unclassified Leptolyngbya]MBD1909249.1 biopolymer transporter ExbD [Leptolyngbya sp. FACHB-8]MBD2156985.1 biopolymer transporter ExbD [Leptolyngbya sp. FACHB-16]